MSYPRMTFAGVDLADLSPDVLPPNTPVIGTRPFEYGYSYLTTVDNAPKITAVYLFPSEAVGQLHWQQVCQIKDDAAAAHMRRLNTLHQEPDISYWQQWMTDVKAFQKRWGNQYVPKDIRDAMSQTEDSFNLPRTFDF